MLELTPEQLATLQNMGGDFFSISECAIALEVPEPALRQAINTQGNPAHKAYHTGRITEVAKHRRNVKDLANRGSSPAQSVIEKWIENS